MEVLFKDGRTPERILVVTRNFIERCVMCLSLHCRSPIESIVAFFALVIGISVSKGTIGRIRDRAAKKAEVFDSTISLAEIKEVATDEIFQQGKPVLTGIDLDTNYAFLMEPSPDRTGNTWSHALEVQKERGLQPTVNVSDSGSGLRKGIQKVFPEISIQADAFHMLRELGIEVRHNEKYVFSKLNEYYKLEKRVIKELNKGLPYKIWTEYCTKTDEIDLICQQVDEVNILYEWLGEYVAFCGYGYNKGLSLCTWILDEMSARFSERPKYQTAIETFRERLPELLSFLRRIQDKMELRAAEYPHLNGHDFMLLCYQKYCCQDNERYNCAERRLYSRFGRHLPEAKKALDEIIHSTHRASSMIENLNGRLRCFIDLKREIPQHFMILIKVFFNTKKPFRSRHRKWRNTSAVERLTGKRYPEFLDLVCSPVDYIIES